MELKNYKERYERLLASLAGLTLGCKLLKSNGNNVINIDLILGGIEKAIKESVEK